MKIGVVFGLDAPPSGNGLLALASWLQSKGHEVTVFQSREDMGTNKGFEWLIGHSYGAANCLKYAQKSFQKIPLMTLIDPVAYEWYLNPFYWLGIFKFSRPENVAAITSYYVHSFPFSARFKSDEKVTETEIKNVPGYDHVGIVKLAVERIMKG